MIIKIICIGKIKEPYYRELIEYYETRIGKTHKVQILQSEDEKIPKRASDAEKQKLIQIESRKSMGKIAKSDFVVALCLEGKKYTTKKLAQTLERAETDGYTAISFLIGGSLGMSEELIHRADVKLSFSDMTFPHQLMRVMLLDQIAKASVICDKGGSD